ncbi:MAG: hypothetical protein KJ630_07670 [Proteobacteria bacterium]|nr:hypothetical protein [Pseudomonadota bacterium]
MYHLDIRTLGALNGFLGLIIAIVVFVVYRTRKTYPGFNFWVYSAFLMLVGMFLLSMRNILPDLITIILANTLIASSMVALNYGIHQFFCKKINILSSLLPIGLFVIAFLYFTYVSPDVNTRIVIISLFLASFEGWAAYCVYTSAPQGIEGKGSLVVFPLLVQSGFFLFRCAYTILMESNIQDFMSASTVQAFTFFVVIGGNIALYLGLIIMNTQKVELELKEAGAAIKTLQGIVPICMHCKQIRDDKGYWNQLEAYISEHTEAQFSHGICDKCLAEHYPQGKTKT